MFRRIASGAFVGLLIVLCLAPGTAQQRQSRSLLNVLVTDPSGAPISQSEVGIDSLSSLPARHLSEKTDDKGRLSISLDAGEYDISAQFPAFRRATHHVIVPPGRNQSVDLVLELDGCPPVCGVMVEGPGEAPITAVGLDEIAAMDSDPILISANIPKHPPLACQARIQRSVKVIFTPAANAIEPSDVKAVKGESLLQSAAVENVKTWRFQNPSAVEQKYETTFDYRLPTVGPPKVTFESFRRVEVLTCLPRFVDPNMEGGHENCAEDDEPVGYPPNGWIGYTNSGVVVSGMTVEALTSHSKRLVATTTTDKAGKFAFLTVSPGRYYLRATKRLAGEKISADVVVTVKKGSNRISCLVAEGEQTTESPP
ncbi:MAG TPA: carboxypeptidase regulatory-like domain-containing protein [Terriglobales bacterium]|jgi:hypothetical protein|nr:carboxypeptidase regulatory-like domain-containing protein [Terriglobales bacterium]